VEGILGVVESGASGKMIVNPAAVAPRDVYKLLIGSIVPRPIAFVSTISANGVPNLAPFSFFNAVCGDPPMVCFSISHRDPSKDTYLNVVSTREFVVNIVSEEIAERMNLTSGDYAHGVSEFGVAGLTEAACEVVKAPRVLESPVSMECRLAQMIALGEAKGGSDLVIGEVVRFHVDDRIVDNYRIDPDKLHAVGRMGGNEYSRTRDRFELIRPKV